MSSITNYLPAVPNNFSTTLSSSISSSDLTIPLNSVSGLPTEGIGVIFAKDTDGKPLASSIEFIHWTNISGNTLTLSDTGDRGITGSFSGSQAHNAGDTFEVWVHSQYYSGPRTAFLAEHDQNGQHGVVAKAGDLSIADQAQGDLLYFNGTSWTRLAAGTSGYFLKTQGAGQNPIWDSINDGWFSSSDTLVYASASSFTISGADRTSVYTKGTRVKFTNNATTFYGIVASSSFAGDTTVQLIQNNDFSIANSAITNPFYSYSANPQGFPTWFNYTPSWTSFGTPQPSLGNGTLDGKFMAVGSAITVSLRLYCGSTTTFGTSIYYLSLPTSNGSQLYPVGTAQAGTAYFNNSNTPRTGTSLYNGWAGGIEFVSSADAPVTNSSPAVWAAGDSLIATFSYQF